MKRSRFADMMMEMCMCRMCMLLGAYEADMFSICDVMNCAAEQVAQ